nr:hypothetical protein A5482_00240 [Cyanobacterium sp. IPPAS B-1200]
MKSVKDVGQANLCIGCGICEAMASDQVIKIKLGEDGFYYPHLNEGLEKQEPWQEIKQVCPGMLVNQDQTLSTQDEKLWGPIAQSWVGYSTDPEIRWQASSGGGITGLLQFLLEKKIVTGVIHIGKSLSNPLTNDVFLSRKREDIIRNSGSRYAPASPLTSIIKILQDKVEKIAFVGKPCDVAALRAYLKLYPQYQEQIVVLITFMCAGTPSMKGTEHLLKTLKVSSDNLQDFWYRGKGWPGKATAIDQDLREFSLSYNQSWGTILNKHLHFRCKVCPDGMGTIGDITFGDAWIEENGYPSFEEQEGKSLIIARNNQGKNFIEQAITQGYLEVDNYYLNNLEKIQPYQAQRKKLIASRILALRLTGLFYPQFSGFYLIDNSLSVSIRENINGTLGTLERLSDKNKFNYFVFKIFSILSLTIQKIGKLFKYFK